MAIPISKYFSRDVNAFLRREPTNEEIQEIVNQLSPLKASGSDGMHALFYQKC